MLVGKRMTKNPITITPDIPITEALEKMRREKNTSLSSGEQKGQVGRFSSNSLARGKRACD